MDDWTADDLEGLGDETLQPGSPYLKRASRELFRIRDALEELGCGVGDDGH